MINVARENLDAGVILDLREKISGNLKSGETNHNALVLAEGTARVLEAVGLSSVSKCFASEKVQLSDRAILNLETADAVIRIDAHTTPRFTQLTVGSKREEMVLRHFILGMTTSDDGESLLSVTINVECDEHLGARKTLSTMYYSPEDDTFVVATDGRLRDTITSPELLKLTQVSGKELTKQLITIISGMMEVPEVAIAAV